MLLNTAIATGARDPVRMSLMRCGWQPKQGIWPEVRGGLGGKLYATASSPWEGRVEFVRHASLSSSHRPLARSWRALLVARPCLGSVGLAWRVASQISKMFTV